MRRSAEGGRRREREGYLGLALVAVLVFVVTMPTAVAKVTVDDIEVPERTLALRAFNVSVELANDGPARTVYLLAALYDPSDGQAPCGPATDARFRTFTELVQEAVELPAASVTRYPAQGDRWQHRYRAEDATPTPEDAQFCVFVANATTGPAIEYESFTSTSLSVRSRNAPPSATFTWTPERPTVGSQARFQAAATDAEDDPIELTWDFGHFDASGRAVGAGASVGESFYPAGEFVVTLTASDGLDAASVSRTVTVIAEARAERERIPELSALAIGAIAVAALRKRI